MAALKEKFAEELLDEVDQSGCRWGLESERRFCSFNDNTKTGSLLINILTKYSKTNLANINICGVQKIGHIFQPNGSFKQIRGQWVIPIIKPVRKDALTPSPVREMMGQESQNKHEQAGTKPSL